MVNVNLYFAFALVLSQFISNTEAARDATRIGITVNCSNIPDGNGYGLSFIYHGNIAASH